MITHPFPPVIGENSRTLILGSFPSVKSRETAFYYGNERNRFWKVVACLYNETEPKTIEEKKKLILYNGLALWDVIKSCEISGSADGSIRNVTVNDIPALVHKYKITKIFTNGQKAQQLYDRFLREETGISSICLPSTSPAFAAISFEGLIEKWKQIIE